MTYLGIPAVEATLYDWVNHSRVSRGTIEYEPSPSYVAGVADSYITVSLPLYAGPVMIIPIKIDGDSGERSYRLDPNPFCPRSGRLLIANSIKPPPLVDGHRVACQFIIIDPEE
ncbi:hypothetical protein DL93DRAFT_2088620 [Clavulina sp. PMI_390]|nr:hypothetical protein DL93DRAFT_2088620 [Clavulina sp. PMI_390]